MPLYPNRYSLIPMKKLAVWRFTRKRVFGFRRRSKIRNARFGVYFHSPTSKQKINPKKSREVNQEKYLDYKIVLLVESGYFKG